MLVEEDSSEQIGGLGKGILDCGVGGVRSSIVAASCGSRKPARDITDDSYGSLG